MGFGTTSILAKTAEQVAITFAGSDLAWAQGLWGRTLTLHGEYDRSICAAAAMRSVATITVALVNAHTYIHARTHTRSTALCPGLPG